MCNIGCGGPTNIFPTLVEVVFFLIQWNDYALAYIDSQMILFSEPESESSNSATKILRALLLSGQLVFFIMTCMEIFIASIGCGPPSYCGILFVSLVSLML
jgi:hypothetical protein